VVGWLLLGWTGKEEGRLVAVVSMGWVDDGGDGLRVCEWF
jgi:hypothetical protein